MPTYRVSVMRIHVDHLGSRDKSVPWRFDTEGNIVSVLKADYVEESIAGMDDFFDIWYLEEMPSTPLS